jgi:hypothetical protein
MTVQRITNHSHHAARDAGCRCEGAVRSRRPQQARAPAKCRDVWLMAFWVGRIEQARFPRLCGSQRRQSRKAGGCLLSAESDRWEHKVGKDGVAASSTRRRIERHACILQRAEITLDGAAAHPEPLSQG